MGQVKESRNLVAVTICTTETVSPVKLQRAYIELKLRVGIGRLTHTHAQQIWSVWVCVCVRSQRPWAALWKCRKKVPKEAARALAAATQHF